MEKIKKILSENEIEEYYREGYILISGAIDPEEIDHIKNSYSAKEKTGAWEARIFDPENPVEDSQAHRLLTHPVISGYARQLLGLDALVYYGMLAIVPANGGKGLPWHQDNMYHGLLGPALNVFTALSDITPDMANLWIAPRTHTSGILPNGDSKKINGHREALEAPENGRPLPSLTRGDICIFDRNTLHRSGINETSNDRYAYAAQYCAASTRWAENGKKITDKLSIEELSRIYQENGLI